MIIEMQLVAQQLAISIPFYISQQKRWNTIGFHQIYYNGRIIGISLPEHLKRMKEYKYHIH